MKICLSGLIKAELLIVVTLMACNQGKNPFHGALLSKTEPEFQTTTEETNLAFNMPTGAPLMPDLGLQAPPPFMPDVPPALPPLLDPLTSGPAFPPPPPNFDDEGVPSRPLIIVPRCGDRILEQVVVAGVIVGGEQCEDGNNISGDGCSDICIEEYCGNGYIEPEHGEECDGGQAWPLTGNPRAPQAWNCDKYCRLIICGNGRVELRGFVNTWQPIEPKALDGEECDLGPLNGGCSGCSKTCELVNPCDPDTKVCTCFTDTDTTNAL